MEDVVRQHGAGGEVVGAPRLLALLTDALRLIDELAYPPEIGARLQEVIDQVQSLQLPTDQ